MPDPNIQKSSENSFKVSDNANGFLNESSQQSRVNQDESVPSIAVLEDNTFFLWAIKKQMPAHVSVDYDSGQYAANQMPKILENYEKQLQQGDKPYQVFVLDFNISSYNDNYADGGDIAEQVNYLAKQYNVNPVFVLNSSDSDDNQKMAMAVKAYSPNAAIYQSQGNKLGFVDQLDDIVAHTEAVKLDQNQQPKQSQQLDWQAEHDHTEEPNPTSSTGMTNS